MLYKFYTIYDRKSGLYGTPFLALNHECAKRDYQRIVSTQSNEFIAPDLELYFIGDWSSDTGVFADGLNNPEFVIGAIENE